VTTAGSPESDGEPLGALPSVSGEPAVVAVLPGALSLIG